MMGAVVALIAAAVMSCADQLPDKSDSTQSGVRYDVVLRGGVVYDGYGAAGIEADVAIGGDRVAAIGDLAGAVADKEIDVTGLAVAPGFINMLSWGVDSLLIDGRGLSDLTQGITLEVFGEGWSMGPLPEDRASALRPLLGEPTFTVDWRTLGEYLERLERDGVSMNVASFVGATTLRIHEVGFDDRPPTPDELDNMRALAREAMEEGALGLASSLIYPPAFFARTEELIALADVAGEYDGMYISHLRSESSRLLQSIEELITIAREAGVPAEIYHLKMAGRNNWGKFDEAIAMIESARAEDLRITANMYLYTAGLTGLGATMPPWSQDGGTDAFLSRLSDPTQRPRIVAAMGERADDWENFYSEAGAAGILLVGAREPSLSGVVGKTLSQVAVARGDDDPRETAVDLILESRNTMRAVYFLMSEENVRKQIALPWMSFGSDGDATSPDMPNAASSGHPRTYGNVPRLLGRYVRDEKIISLGEAIRKLTSLPAANLDIRSRGVLAEGYYADITVFDPATIQDNATYEDFDAPSTGVVHVFVNGEQVLADGRHTGAMPGRVVRGPGWTGWRDRSDGTADMAGGTQLPD